jgi:uncharacterized protein YndB with AHSA1/START domain
MTKPDFMMQTYIRCTQDALWDALTDPGAMAKYHFMSSRVTRDGDIYVTHSDDGSPMMTCRTLSMTPKTRIETDWTGHWPDAGAPSRVVYSIDVEGDHCRLTVEHFDLTYPVVKGEGIDDGWTRWAAGLKTWLETGTSVRFREPQMQEA